MEKRTSLAARAFAALALVVAVVIVIVAISGALGGDSDSAKQGHQGTHHAAKHHHRHRTKAATYVVEGGDTLTEIARKTGVSVAEILRLNPEIDPQVLSVGETLKLK